ncbi:MAG: amidohydrolase [Candidatus Cloacimonetes bacterium]|nr:amidohydrolase [Candidatus Cloacimonadota bacterium]
MTTIFYGGPIYGHPEAEALLVVNDSIFHIGTLAECVNLATGPLERINLQDKMLLPAFTDGHTHFVEYAKSQLLVNLQGTSSISEIEDYLRKYRDKLSWKAEWILGGGWDRNLLEQPLELSKELLDRVFPDIPVALFSRDYHAKLLNSKALHIVGIDANTPEPEGGKFERRPDGSLSGVLYETATEMIDPFIIQPPETQVINSIQLAVKDIYKWGLIGFHSMEYKASKDLLLKAQAQGSKFRFCWHFQSSELDEMIGGEARSYEGDEFFKVGGLKLFGDGALGSCTAAMFDPYPQEADNYGILRYRDEELYRSMEKAAQAGFASTIHAIGDRCVRQVIDCTLKLNKNPEYKDLFHRIEHVQSIRHCDIPLLKQSGLFASLQPVHIANDIPMIHKSWPQVVHQAYAFKSMLEAGIPYAFGSDAPIETMNPFHGIYSALQRRHKVFPDGEALNVGEAITAAQAIDGYSIGAAMASCSGHIRGKIEKGYLADLIVIEDYRCLPDEYWIIAESLLTMMGGEIVYRNF